MCKDSGASRASLSDLKMGRNKRLSSDTLSKIATYFGVSVDYLLGKEEQKETPDELTLTEDEIRIIKALREKPDGAATLVKLLGISDN